MSQHSSYSSFDNFPEDADSSEHESCSELFTQLDVWDHHDLVPPYLNDPLLGTCATWYDQSDLDEAKLILELLKNADCALTKNQLARARYPKIFKMSITKILDAEGRSWNITKIIQAKYVEKIGRALRSISDCINRKLDELDNEPVQKVTFLREVSLAIQVDQDEKGRALYVYHGPDFPQPPEIIEMYLMWTEKHQDRNGRLQRLASELLRSHSNVEVMQLNHQDLPGVSDLTNDNDFTAEGS